MVRERARITVCHGKTRNTDSEGFVARVRRRPGWGKGRAGPGRGLGGCPGGPLSKSLSQLDLVTRNDCDSEDEAKPVGGPESL